MLTCDQCYESGGLCRRAGDRSLSCDKKITIASAARSAAGDYSATFTSALPDNARWLDGTHFDALTGHTPVAHRPVALDADEAYLEANLNTMDTSDVALAVDLAMKRPGLVDEIKKYLRRAEQQAKTEVGVLKCRNAEVRINEIVDAQRKLVKESVPGTPKEFQAKWYPRATLFQYMIKGQAKGTVLMEEAKTYFDKETGKQYIPFERATKLDSDPQFMYCVFTFVTTMQLVTGEAPFVYFNFMRDVTRCCTERGARFTHEYVDNILKALDEGRYPSMVALYKAGEYNRIRDELNLTKPVGSSEGKPGGTSKRIQFDKTTLKQALGGKGAGLIPRKCNNFHASPQTPCVAGVPFNKGHHQDHEGLCAYQH